MPMVQATDVPSAPPGGLPQAGALPDAYQHIQSTAASFGSLEGSALEQLGGTIGKAADTFAERAIELQKIHNTTVVEDANTQYMKKTNNLLFGDPDVPGDTGFYGTKGQEAALKRHSVLQALNDHEKTLMTGLQNDAQRLAFQHESRYNRRWIDRDIGSHYEKEMVKAGEESAKAAFSIASQTAGRNYSDPERHKDGLLAADDLARKESHGDPTIEQSLRNKYRDQVYVEIAHGYSTQNDWDGARKWFDANKQYISDPKVADTINQHIHDKSIDADVITRFLTPGAGAPAAGATLFDRIVNQGERSSQSTVSPKGATGKAQVLPETAQEVARANNIPWDENKFRTDEKYNMQLGQLHLDRLVQKYGGNEALASAAYNAGEARVDEWVKTIGDPRTGAITNKEFVDKIPFEETRNYVRRVGADTSVVQQQGGATRNQPIAYTLNVQLERASTAVGNLKVEVFSGGQPSRGPNRVGTHRHDEGEAADIQLRDTMTGKLLDMRVPADRARMAQFITESVRSGATGVGAAVDYMGPHGIHIGGGPPAAWGGDGTSATTPGWVRSAFEAGRSGAAPVAPRASAPPAASAARASAPTRSVGPTEPELSGSGPELAAFYEAVRKGEATAGQFDQWLTAYRAKPAAPTATVVPRVPKFLVTGGTVTAPEAPPGMAEIGNIDLNDRPEVKNPDGSISTVASMSFNENGKEVLIPTVSADGMGILSPERAIQQYKNTGQHLGKFDTPENATAYAQGLHEEQAARSGGSTPLAPVPTSAGEDAPATAPTYIPPAGAPPTPPPTPGPAPIQRDIAAEVAQLRRDYPNPTDFVKAYNAYSRVITMENTIAHQKHTATQAASEAASKTYTDRIIKGDYAGVMVDIAKDQTLTAEHTRALYSMATTAQNHEINKFEKTHGTGFYDVWRRAFAAEGDPNRITDTNQILQMVGDVSRPGYLTPSGAREIMNQLLTKKTPEGHADAQMYDELFKASSAKLSFTGLESLGVKDDQGHALQLRFMQQAFPEIIRLKKEGIPMAQITDLEKGPLKPMLDKLVRPPEVVFQNYITRMQQLQLGINPATGQRVPPPPGTSPTRYYDNNANPIAPAAPATTGPVVPFAPR